MLSKKMAFSLTSLITILALAFVVTPAMAGEFDVTLDMTGDISTADGLQVDHPGTSLEVTVKFGQAVVLAAGKVFVTTFDKDGTVTGFPAATVDPATAEKEIMLTIPVAAGDTKVNIRIAKGIASHDPINADTSKEFNVDVQLLASDVVGGPTVYSIRRNDGSSIPVKAATVDVIITLSEMPKEFKKGNIDVSNATHGDPVALTPIAGQTTAAVFRTLATGTDSPAAADLTPLRKLYGDDGIHVALRTNKDLLAAAKAYIEALAAAEALQTAGSGAISLTTTATDTVIAEADLPDDAGTTYSPLLHPTLTTDSDAPAVPDDDDSDGANALNESKLETAIQEAINAADLGVDRTVAPTKPKATDAAVLGAANPATHLTALNALYLARRVENELYMAEKALHAAYMKAVQTEKDADISKRREELQEYSGQVLQFSTGRTGMLYPYVLTITPKYENKDDIVVKVKAFENQGHPTGAKYTPPTTESGYVEGRHKLTIKVGKENLVALASGTRLDLPHGEGAKIPANGFYLLTKNKDGSGINYSHEKDAENLAHKQTPAQLLFNVRAAGIANLENFFLSGGTIDLVAYDGTAATAAYISEVMWGSDASQTDASNSQWIEIMNATASAISIGEKKWALWFYQAHETPASSYTGGTLIDRIGTERSDTGVFWSVLSENKGQSGRTNVDPGGADVAAIAPTRALVSMIRVTDAAGTPANGTLPTSWAATATGTSANFKLGIEGTRWATPGAADIARPTAPAPPPPPAPKVPIATATDIMITEIMVDTGNGRLPQWIELTHVGTGEVSLDGWEMVIDNAIDAEVIGRGNAITVSLSGVTLDVSAHPGNTGKGQSALVVAWKSARHSNNIMNARVIDLSTQLQQKRQYQLLSYNGFRITLAPPRTGASIASFGDIAGNLHEDWGIPMDEGSTRSSIIRRQTDYMPNKPTHVASKNFTGTDAKGWILASETSLTTGQVSYYGSDEDQGTPGQDIGGPLPVELSHFRPARDKATGAVVITWATESELNNAGFFIKRSNQRNGQFQVVNATMIPGAGTTSEKQFYTYTDTTAQPNVVYYYQIEDVSLDGNRQTLTRGIRLKGHVGAAGKATTLWGELKTSHE